MKQGTTAGRPQWGLAALLGALAGCAGGTGEAPGGPTVTVQVAALNLVGVGDVVWDVEVVNGRADTPDVVWRQRLASSRFGDGAGSVSYVGPCDATAGVHENEVRLWVVGVYAGPVTAAGAFGEAPPAGVLAFENPTPYDAIAAQWAPPLERPVTCREDADSPVRFDVALMRPADQGFFDIAVNFNDIFCSAKFDCCVEREAGCPDIKLLHDGDGERATTFVLGFACTAGTGSGVETELYLDALALDCTSPFAAELAIDPAGGPGNLCAAAGDASTCAGVVGASAETWLYQVATYRGREPLPSGGVAGHKVYWNVALGVNRPAIAGCRLRTRGTAMDGASAGGPTGGVVPAGAVYPFVQWDVDLGTCRSEALTFGDPTAMVRTGYTGTGDGPTSFAYGFGAQLPPMSTCVPTCPGGVCVAADGGGTTCLCGPGRVAHPQGGCVLESPCADGECSGSPSSGLSAAAGTMESATHRLEFQLGPAAFGYQGTDGAVRLFGTLVTYPTP